MGLDMYLIKRKKGEANWEKATDIGYWRKANQVMGFFERELDGLEDCETKVVSKDILEKLNDLCIELLIHHDADECAERLPTTEGFFYGSQAYNDSYWYDLILTVNILYDALKHTDFDNEEVGFYAWW